MRRHAANVLAVVLLGVGLAAGAVWARSYAVVDAVYLRVGGRMVCVYSFAGTVVVTAERLPAPAPGWRVSHAGEWNVPEPVGGSYVGALLDFHVHRPPSGLTSVHFPHWPVAAAAAAWPLVRFVRWRQRRARAAVAGFPVEAPGPPARF